MKGLQLFAICLLLSAVAAGQSGICSADGHKPCQSFPLSLLDWNEEGNEIDTDRTTHDDAATLNDGGSLSLIERLLLFPVCFFDKSQCNKYTQRSDGKFSVFKMCQDTDKSCLLEYSIEKGWLALHGIIESIQQANSVDPPQYIQNIYQMLPRTLSAVQNVFSFVTTRITSMIISLGEISLPDIGSWNTVTAIHDLFGRITWTLIRYLIVGLIAASLFPTRKQLGKFTRKAISTTKYLYRPSKEKGNHAKTSQPPNLTIKEHYPMCEYFDHKLCNCGGRSSSKEAKIEDQHYKMCEFFDELQCNCGGVETITACTETGLSVSDSAEDQLLDSNVLISKADTHCKDAVVNTNVLISKADTHCEDAIVNTDSTINELKSFNDPECVEMIPQWVQMAVGGIRLSETLLLTCLDKRCSGTETRHLEQLTYSNISPCNGPEIEEDLKVERASEASDSHPENNSPKKVQFDMDTHLQRNEENHSDKNVLSSREDDSFNTDSENESFVTNLNDSNTSDIGFPFLNSSFKEDSPYVTANTVPYEDLLDRGDGVIFSTLTRRSPYAEEGLTDLSTETSMKESDGSILDSSILDVSDLNNSISFSSGEGIFEIATLIAFQTLWRIAQRVWQNRTVESNTNDVTIEEKESGLFVIRQRNKRKGFGSPTRTTCKPKSELPKELDENNSCITECLTQNEVINTLNTGEQSTSVEKNNNSANDAFSKLIHHDPKLENVFKTTDCEANITSETPSNNEIDTVAPNFNNNARYSKRKRSNPKRHSDSSSKTDGEDCDHPDNSEHKRGRTVYKTRETLDKCYAKNHDRSGNSGKRYEINTATEGCQADKKRQSTKHGPGASAANKSTRKKVRKRKNIYMKHRNISNEVQDKIDKLSRDLSNASMNDNIGVYVGDTSDEFADDSSSSSDEKALMKCDILGKKVLRTPPVTPLFKEGLRSVTPYSQNRVSCSCVSCKQKELNDIVRNLRSQQSNIWQLKEYEEVYKNDIISDILAWAWSCVEK